MPGTLPAGFSARGVSVNQGAAAGSGNHSGIISMLGFNTKVYVLTKSLEGQRVMAVYHLGLPVSAFRR